MKTITGPISCVLCGHQTWNGRVKEAISDGNESKYVCFLCFGWLISHDFDLVETSKEQIAQIMTRLRHA